MDFEQFVQPRFESAIGAGAGCAEHDVRWLDLRGTE
jgi:hypothetical protein